MKSCCDGVRVRRMHLLLLSSSSFCLKEELSYSCSLA